MKKKRRILDIRLSDDMSTRLNKYPANTEYFVYDTEDIKTMVRCGTVVHYDVYSISLGLNGEGKSRLNSKPYSFVRNTVSLTSPSTETEVISLSEDYESISIVCPPAFLGRIGFFYLGESVFQLFSSNSDPFLLLNDEQAASLLFSITRLRELSQNQTKPFYYEMTQNYFVSMVYELTEIYNAKHYKDPIKLGRNEELLAAFINSLCKYFKENRSLKFYADKLGLSAKYLSHLVKANTGKTAKTLIEEAIIVEAKRILLHPGSTISKVAADLNFSNQSIFGKFFKKYVGIAPSEYRFMP